MAKLIILIWLWLCPQSPGCYSFTRCFSFAQDDWNPDWQSTSSSKVTYLVCRLKELQETNRMIGYFDEKRENMSNELNLSSNKSYFNTSLDQDTCQNFSNQIPLEKVIVFSQFLEHIHIIEQQVTFGQTCTWFSVQSCSSTNELVFFKTFSQLSIAGIEFAGMYSPMHSSNKVGSHSLLFLWFWWLHAFNMSDCYSCGI